MEVRVWSMESMEFDSAASSRNQRGERTTDLRSALRSQV